MHVDIDVDIERMEKRVTEFLEKHGQKLGIVHGMIGGPELIAAAKRLNTAAKKLRDADSTVQNQKA